ncbi:GAP family protein [Mycobacterium sp. ITM-2016-00317]|uniref:GAP family protein n=1 Tax=Mycobacterium sp. ITM-2016-00317 TaxID=2099694 RepID=UPI000D41EE6C|nr:GAP family protein [Mycobacterium sp. ITM-2016-00317]WNG88196.1 GAP family protein [Mycobacterium sp. ITM-2016-00317]
MSASWSSILTELIPLALVIALSPLSIIPAVLVLRSARPRPTGLAFLIGWLIGLTVLTVLALQLSSLIGGIGGHPPGWASWLRIVVGGALIVFGGYRWLTREKSEHMPGWMTRMSTLTPAKAGGMAAALTVLNPKVLLICVAAGLAIGSAGLEYPSVYGAVVWFVAVAGVTVALPILGYSISGRRLDPALTRLNDWMERRHAALVAAILVVIGAMVLYKGIHALLG